MAVLAVPGAPVWYLFDKIGDDHIAPWCFSAIR